MVRFGIDLAEPLQIGPNISLAGVLRNGAQIVLLAPYAEVIGERFFPGVTAHKDQAQCDRHNGACSGPAKQRNAQRSLLRVMNTAESSEPSPNAETMSP